MIDARPTPTRGRDSTTTSRRERRAGRTRRADDLVSDRGQARVRDPGAIGSRRRLLQSVRNRSCQTGDVMPEARTCLALYRARCQGGARRDCSARCGSTAGRSEEPNPGQSRPRDQRHNIDQAGTRRAGVKAFTTSAGPSTRICTRRQGNSPAASVPHITRGVRSRGR